ncbi:MAG: carboxypeptidase regulatory-like domain-containing protein [Myxococcales bacterium]|nr:carboxypeptidase regulatory-like domain-containing protein [Myxococcales bacterium]
MASSISGRVRGLDGAPAAGVEVSVLDGAVANTDDRGEFRLTPLPPGRYSVVARADGARGRAEHSVLLGLGEHAGGVEIRLRAATRLRAVIVDEEDHPLCLSGQVQLSPSAPGIDDLESGISLVSEAEFLVAPPGQYYAHVRCDEPSVAFSVPGVEVERESQTLRWSAPSGAGVRGCVVRDGERLAGAGVTLDGVEEDPPVHRVARLDAGGCFAFTRVPPGRYRVGPDPYGEQTATILDRRFALERRDVELTLELADTATLWGGMVDQDGAPLVGYTIVVELRGARRAKLERVTTAGGEFRFDVVPTGALQVAVRDRDGRDVALAGAFAGAPALTIGDGEARALNLSLARGVGRISGSVRDSGGAELSDVFVTAVREDEERGLMSGSDSNLLGVAGGRTVLCDVDGSFALENLSEGTYRVLAFERGGREVSRAGVAIGSSVELVLEDEASVRGSVTLPGGDAPERFELIARASSGVGVSEVFEGTEGRWFLEGLNEGKYEVSATADGGFAALARVATEAGEVTTLELELAAPATISGRLVDASTGKPVAGVKVWAGSSLVLSDEQGAFRLEEVPVTEMSLFAWNGHGAEHRLARRRLTLASGEYVELGVIELSRVGAR